MKVKDIERTANVAWSPKDQHPIYLAAGTAAQQLDASFSTSAALEIYALKLAELGPDCKPVSSLPSEHRFHKIIWGSHGADNGTIITGCDEGLLEIYNASKLLKGEPALVGKQQKHSGPVHALDFNSFQQNLFATGAGDSEIFIWDLNNCSSPMSPGAKSQPLEDILSVAWNKQVQHILASSFASKCVIWDLRKNEPIIKLTDTISRIRWKMVTWHPEVATQLCLASEEDHSPIIQLWDLRFATSPLKTLENHQRGVLAVAWCAADPDLLVSCGKDDRLLCWNPNSNHTNGEILSEIARTNQWSFDVVWCPRNPALIACPNYDGHVSVYSLMGGKTQQIQTTNKIADSFPGMEGYAQAPTIQQSTVHVSNDPTKPPKWLKRPVGASFGFGGKLISFSHDKEAIVQAQQNSQPGQPVTIVPRTVQISQVITEPDLVQKSDELEKALEYGNFTDYCLNKSNSADDQHKKYIWHFLKANFEQNPRAEILNLLGYSIEDVNAKLSKFTGTSVSHNNVDGLTDDFSNISRLDDFPTQEDEFNSIAQSYKKRPETPFLIKTADDTEGLITQALLLNNVEAAVELCLKAERFADALIIATTGGPDLLARTQHKYLEKSEGYISFLISAIVSEDWSSIINGCDISSWKEALAAMLTHANEEDLPLLCEQLGTRLERESVKNPKYAEDAQLCYICSGNFEKLVSSWSDNAYKSTNNLQELIELVSFLQKAIERQGKQVQVHGALAELLSHYASILAAQGNLTTALVYLGNSHDPKVASLRDRLLTSLGQKPTNVQELRHQQQQSRRNSTRVSGQYTNAFQPINNQFGGVASQAPSYGSVTPQIPPYGGVTPQVQPPATNQFGGSYNTGLPNPGMASQPWQTHAPPPLRSSVGEYGQAPGGAFSPPPVSLGQPARPGSVENSHGTTSGHLPRKHVLDPSVSSNQYGSRGQFGSIPSASFNQTGYTPAATFAPLPPTPNIPGSRQSMFSPAPNPVLNPAPLVPNPVLNPSSMPGPAYNSSQPAGFIQNYEVAQEAASYNNAPSGWNDPPIFSKKQTAKQDLPPPEPIRHPIFGAEPESLPPNGYAHYPNEAPPTQSYNNVINSQSAYAPFNQAPPINEALPVSNNMYQPPQLATTMGYNPGGFNQNALGPQQQRGSFSQEVAKPETPPPVQKPPIPEEHLHMQTVFDELKDRCSCSANNPQTKRKLEDVGKRLENLYDCLRYNKLSSNALASLHQMVQLVQNGDYPNGLLLHTQLVQGPDFSQIAGFMPGLKMLLQLGLQLHVYLN